MDAQYKILYTERARDLAEPSTIVDSPPERVMTTPHLTFEFYEHIYIRDFIKTAVWAEENGYDAIVTGCFYDPGLREARELVKIPVVGVCEASLHIASMITAGKFSILVSTRKEIPKMTATTRDYGFESKIASWRMLNVPVPEMRDKKKLKAAILREGRIAVNEDGAECIVLGCTGMFGQAKEIQEILGVPVLDPVLMGLKVAELRAMLWKRFGISHSKIGGYASPPKEELEPIWKKFYNIS